MDDPVKDDEGPSATILILSPVFCLLVIVACMCPVTMDCVYCKLPTGEEPLGIVLVESVLMGGGDKCHLECFRKANPAPPRWTR